VCQKTVCPREEWKPFCQAAGEGDEDYLDRLSETFFPGKRVGGAAFTPNARLMQTPLQYDQELETDTPSWLLISCSPVFRV